MVENKKNDTFKKIIDQNNDLNEIVEVRYGDEIYKTWTNKLILPFIIRFLKGIYSKSLVVRGLTDIVVFDNTSDDIVPVEIQKTPLSTNKTFSHSQFEKEIRKGLEDNITNYGKCWLFFDSEYLRYLRSGNVRKQTSINMTWLVKFMKEEKLKVFTVKYDGTVKELTTKDFDFLKDVSQTCVISCDSDERVLDRNKLKIKKNVLHGHNFTQEEITRFESEFDNCLDKGKKSSISTYCVNSENIKCKLYGNILYTIGHLPIINDNLSCTSDDRIKLTYLGVTLGLFEQNDFNGHNKHARIKFIDKFNIAQYFPGYIKNKEMWDYCKNKQRIFTMDEFRGIIEGTFNYEFIKKQSTMLDY